MNKLYEESLKKLLMASDFFLTAILLERVAMPAPTKLQNSTNLGQGSLGSTQLSQFQSTLTGIYRWSIILADTNFFQQSESVSAANFRGRLNRPSTF